MLRAVAGLLILVLLVFAGPTGYVLLASAGRASTVAQVPAQPVAIVFGASVYSDGTPSPYLRARALDRLADRLVDGVLTVSASEQRSQWQNRLSAEQKLADVLAAAIAPPPRPRVPTKPSASARRRRVDDKKHRGQIKKLRRGDPD